jgi:2-dehydro-3-deoxygalactonokinase
LATGALSGCPLALEALNGQYARWRKSVDCAGLKWRRPQINVMRGEETQLLGAWQLAPAELRAAGHPLQMGAGENGVVRHFATAMTGELHHLLDAIAARQRAAGPAAG